MEEKIERLSCEGDDDDDDDDDDDNGGDDEDDDEEAWEEMGMNCETFISCLFCTQSFKTMAIILDHCKTHHNFNLMNLKNKFNMDCYSYICMVNYLRKVKIDPDTLLSFKEPPWLNGEYLLPVVQDDPWLMFDFDGLESPRDDIMLPHEENYHVVNSENGLVTLTEQHFAQLQHRIKHLTIQVQEKEKALSVAVEQIQEMRAVTQNFLYSDSSERSETKMKFSVDDGYFSSYSHFAIHHEMLSDKVRTSKYRDAIMKNASLISGKTILDVGCGTGILSMFAATAEASKVYAVDQSDIIYSAMDIVRENNLSDKIDLIHGKVEDIVLPTEEKVDVIISEWMGYFLLFEGMFDSIVTARNRFLKKNGHLLPNRCVLHLAGVSDPDIYQEMLGFWSDVYGFKMSCLVKEVVREAQIFQVPSHTVATNSVPILNLDLYKADVNSTDFTADFTLESSVDGNLTALFGYFDAFFDLPKPEVLSTDPKQEKTHWKQTVFFLPNLVPIKKGSLLNGTINCRRSAEDSRALTITINLLGQQNEYYLK